MRKYWIIAASLQVVLVVAAHAQNAQQLRQTRMSAAGTAGEEHQSTEFIVTPIRPRQVPQTNIQPRQVVQCTGGPTGYVDQSKCVFPKPTLPGNLLIFIIDEGCGNNTCNSVGDTQRNVFGEPVIVPYDNGTNLYYALRTKGGPDGIVLGPNVGSSAILFEYPPALNFEGGAMGNYFVSNAALGVPNGSSNDLGWTTPVEATASGDLIISWGKSNTHPNQGAAPVPGPFFKIEADVGESFAAEDMTGAGPGLYIGTMGWNVYSHWTLGVAVFKMLQHKTLAIQTCIITAVANNEPTYSCEFSSPNFAGDTLVLPEVGTIASVTDTNGNMWVMDQSRPQLGFWHASNIKAGPNTVTVKLESPGAFNGGFAEYPASSVQVLPIADGSGTMVTPPIISGSGIVLGFGTQWTNSYQPPTAFASGFSLESQEELYFADKRVSGGNVQFSATYPYPVNWFAGVAILAMDPQQESAAASPKVLRP